jgi:type VI secretion system secreted protein Hcp
MTYSGYLKIEDIPGESTRRGHEGEIDIHGVAWLVTQDAAASAGSGRARGRAEIAPFQFYKWNDASSPHLALAVMNGRALPEVLVSLSNPAAPKKDYLVITLANCRVTAYEILPPTEADLHAQVPARRKGSITPLLERLAIDFERVRIRYTTFRPDGSAGAEHEVEYDVAAST